MKIDYNQPDDDFGDASARMTRAVFAEGVERAVLLMRHSAREYRRDIHDLENPLTDAGRALAARFGAALPDVNLRGYSSPVTRCRDTALLAIDASMSVPGSPFGFRFALASLSPSSLRQNGLHAMALW